METHGQKDVPHPEMLVDVVDLTDRPIGMISRREVLPARANFRVVHVFLRDSRRRVLLQQLSATRERNPLRWGASVAAYLFSGETYEEAACRRLSQELSVTGVPLSSVGKTSMLDESSIKFVEAFEASYDGPIIFDDSHIASVAFRTIEDIAPNLKAEPTK